LVPAGRSMRFIF